MFITARGKKNSDTDQRSLSVDSVSGEPCLERHSTITVAAILVVYISASDIKREGQTDRSLFLTFVFNRTFLNEGKRNRPSPMDYLHIFVNKITLKKSINNL